MDKKINHNQAGLILCIFTIALKLSALPAIMYSFSNNDTYMACILSAVFDFLGALIIITIMQKHPDKTFFELISTTLGKAIAIIIEIMLLIYLLSKAVITIQELHDYFITTLFDDLNPIYFFGIIALLIVYCTTKDYRTIGRVMQLTFWPILLCIGFTLIFPISDMQVERLLPIFEQGIYPILRGIFKTNFAFGDYIILLLLMGKVDIKPKFKKQMLSYLSITLSFIIIFFILFVGSFGDFSISQTLAIGELPLHSTTPSTIGKLEWLTVVIWTGILLLNTILISVSSRQCFDNIFNMKNRNTSSTITTIIIIIIVLGTYLKLDDILMIVTSEIFSSISFAMQALLILVAILSSIIANKSKKKFSPGYKRRQAKC